jgi:hypothetical protein
MNASSKPDKLPTAARQPACYRRSAVWRAPVEPGGRPWITLRAYAETFLVDVGRICEA